MFERFTDRARKVSALANQEARRFNHEYIGTEHILLGLVKEGAGVGARALKNLNVDLRKVRMEVEKLMKSGPEMLLTGELPQTPRAKKVIEYATEEARNLNHNYVGTEHLLLGLLREEEGVAAQVLVGLGVQLDRVREEVLNLLGASDEDEEARSTRSFQVFAACLIDGVKYMLVAEIRKDGSTAPLEVMKMPDGLSWIRAHLVEKPLGILDIPGDGGEPMFHYYEKE